MPLTSPPFDDSSLHDDELIFVSVAAYRDAQLVPTVIDCLQKASRPERLRFGICWQRDPLDAPLPFAGDARFRILDVDWRQSRGACWARAEVMHLWQGEDWLLQVDSHCRFASGWDATLLRLAEETGSAKPVLSTYAAPFTPGGDEVLRDAPQQIAFLGFSPEGTPQLKPVALPAQGGLPRSRRARFLAAGFLFAPGRFVSEVPYDPELYFLGEESAMTVRAFTNGYDLFHPAETIIWHDYVRADARKHWGDHTEEDATPLAWQALDQASRRKVQRLLCGELVQSFGLGSARTLQQYEAYAGISFKLRCAQQYTVRGLEPPNPETGPDWTNHVYLWIAKVELQRSQLPAGALDDPSLWCVAIQDKQGLEIFRRDYVAEELGSLSGVQERIVLIAEFSSETSPAAWTLWPMNRHGGWLQMMSAPFQEGDFAMLDEDGDEDEELNENNERETS